jgi:two-component system cell cycle sensor histidine kinase/response regulator CckA
MPRLHREPAADPCTPTILLVEEHGSAARDVARQLSRAGYDVIALARSLDDASAKARLLNPDLVVLCASPMGARALAARAAQLRAGVGVPVMVALDGDVPDLLAAARAAATPGVSFFSPHDAPLHCAVDIVIGRCASERSRRAVVQDLRTDTAPSIGCVPDNVWQMIDSAVEQRTDALAAAAESLSTYASQVERRLRATEHRFRALLDSSSDGVWLLSPDGIILEGNQRGAELHGCEVDAVLGRRYASFAAPERAATERERFARLVQDGDFQAQGVEVVRPDGTRRIVDYTCRLTDIDGEAAALVVERDVTEQRRLEREVEQYRRTEAIAHLAGAIAHDFNNILSVVLGTSELLLEDLPVDSEERDDVGEILHAGQRGAALARQLLAFGRKAVREPTVIDLGQVVSGLEPMLRRLIGGDVVLTIRSQPGLGTVYVDPGQLEQVIMNLVINARDAMPMGGTITVELYDDVEIRPGRRGGCYTVVEVRDSGCGMEAAALQRIFEPFFTTKGARGTGLGLSTCQGIVAQSGGYIDVTSSPGHGSTFRVALPRIDGLLETTRDEVAPAPLRGSETLLLVEDDAAVAEVIARLLDRLGYQVVVAGDAPAAIAACESQERIDLVLCDLVVPGGTAIRILQHVRQRFPEARALVMSGYSEHPALAHTESLERTHFLAKPFSSDLLARHLRGLLDDRPGSGDDS